MITPPYDVDALADRRRQLVAVTRELALAGWTPATSSNFSMRLDDRHVAITVSGRDKGSLSGEDIVVMDLEGRPVATEARLSAEALLHAQIYRRLSAIGCVLHTHSVTQTVAARLYACERRIRLQGYEMLKAFAGIKTHEAIVDLPILPNNQDMRALAAQVEPMLDSAGLVGYLIDGHGLYSWGRDLGEARRHLEAFEFLVRCELELRRLST